MALFCWLYFHRAEVAYAFVLPWPSRWDRWLVSARASTAQSQQNQQHAADGTAMAHNSLQQEDSDDTTTTIDTANDSNLSNSQHSCIYRQHAAAHQFYLSDVVQLDSPPKEKVPLLTAVGISGATTHKNTGSHNFETYYYCSHNN